MDASHTQGRSRLSRRGLLSAGVGVGATAALSACAGLTGSSGGPSEGSGRTSVRFFWYVEGKRAAPELNGAKDFMAKHPEISVETLYTSWADYWDKLATDVAGGNPADGFQLDPAHIADYASRGVIQPLDDLVPELRTALEPNVLASCSYQGKLVVVPSGLSTVPGLAIDTDTLKQLGLSMPSEGWGQQEFSDFCNEVWDKSGHKVSGCDDFGGSYWAMLAYVRSRGEAAFADDGSLTLTKDTLGDWFDFVDSLRKSQGVVPISRTAEGGGFGNAPMVTGESLMATTASAKGILGLETVTKHTLDLIEFPRATKNGPIGTLLIPVENFAVSAKSSSDKAKAIAEYMWWLLNDTKNLQAMVVEHGIPSLPKLRSQAEKGASSEVKPTWNIFHAVASKDPAALTPLPPGSNELLGKILSDLNQDIGFGKKTVPQGVGAFFDSAKKVLKA